jgi:phosphopantothenoylcysteine decarboxylase
MPKIVLGVTGSVAAIRIPLLYRELTRRGHEVRVVLTEHATYFFNPDAVPGALVFRDSDEWPKTKTGELYQPGDPVLHIELRRWAELLLVAPLDAHTLAKFALGLCDNLLTCLYRAWDRRRPILLAPAMNTLMWEHPATLRHLQLLLADHTSSQPSDIPAPSEVNQPEQIVEIINRYCPYLRIVGPVSKRLACGDEGMGGMAEVEEILAAVEAFGPTIS